MLMSMCNVLIDCLDYGNYKKALQESDRVLKKHPTSHNAKVIIMQYFLECVTGSRLNTVLCRPVPLLPLIMLND